MNEVPWWALSPSPMTCLYWSILAFYGAYKLGSNSKREWIKNFCESAFLLGIVILTYDTVWQLGQWFKFGYLHPEEIITVRNTLIRNASVFSLCALSSWKLSLKTNLIQFKGIFFILVPILSLSFRFLVAPDPSWTDFTYGLRFGGSLPWWYEFLSGVPDKGSLAITFMNLWKH